MQAGIREILIITTPHDAPLFQKLLGDGSRLGCEFTYTIQENPEGLAQAFILGEEFIGNDSVALILGDNIFYGSSISAMLQSSKNPKGGVVFAYRVSDPERYGVVEFDENMKALSIDEKPAEPKSDYAVPGLYFYDKRVVEITKNLKPSPRGELEITDVNKQYLKWGELEVSVLDRGTAWLDTGTFVSLQQAGQFVEVIEERQGMKVGCIEEIAFEQGFIDADQLSQIAQPLVKSGYGKYLLTISKPNV
jgi:glucose-1-phosphate thymidylyltransferase